MPLPDLWSKSRAAVKEQLGFSFHWHCFRACFGCEGYPPGSLPVYLAKSRRHPLISQIRDP